VSGGPALRSIHDLTTEEAYRIAAERCGESLPPLDAVENEDWGRDYVLQRLVALGDETLASLGLTTRPPADEESS
jgi:hypothetical protein